MLIIHAPEVVEVKLKLYSITITMLNILHAPVTNTGLMHDIQLLQRKSSIQLHCYCMRFTSTGLKVAMVTQTRVCHWTFSAGRPLS